MQLLAVVCMHADYIWPRRLLIYCVRDLSKGYYYVSSTPARKTTARKRMQHTSYNTYTYAHIQSESAAHAHLFLLCPTDSGAAAPFLLAVCFRESSFVLQNVEEAAHFQHETQNTACT